MPAAGNALERRDAMIGRILGKYTLLRLLGTGGNGSVWLAREVNVRLAVPRLLAVKTFRETRNAVGHLLDEARIATSLDHPNIVRLHEFGEVDGLWFFGMDFVSGETFLDLGKSVGRLPAPASWAWPASLVASACRGLQHAHEKQIVHRDIKPRNLMVRYDGNVTIVDFGIAKALKQRNVHTGIMRGTPAYMSPEQIATQPVDARSDLFSLGAVLYELCTRSRLFHRNTLVETAYAITQGEIPPPRSRAPELPKTLEQIIMRMLARKREDRFSSAAEIERALRELLMREQFADYDAPQYMRTLFGERIEHMDRIAELAKTVEPRDLRLAEERPKIIAAAAQAVPIDAPTDEQSDEPELEPEPEPTDEAPPQPAMPPPPPVRSVSAFDAGTTINPETVKPPQPRVRRSLSMFGVGLAVLAAGIVLAGRAWNERGEGGVTIVEERAPELPKTPPKEQLQELPKEQPQELPKAQPQELPKAQPQEEPAAEPTKEPSKPRKLETSPRPKPTKPKPVEPPPAAGPGTLSVALTCAGQLRAGTVFIDDRSHEAPLEITVASGTHRIRVRSETGEPLIREVKVSPDKSTPVAIDICGKSKP